MPVPVPIRRCAVVAVPVLPADRNSLELVRVARPLANICALAHSLCTCVPSRRPAMEATPRRRVAVVPDDEDGETNEGSDEGGPRRRRQCVAVESEDDESNAGEAEG